MTSKPAPSTDEAPTAFYNAVPDVASGRWAEVLGQGLKLGVFVVFAMYVANLIVLPLLTNGRVEDFIHSPYRALEKLLVAFAISIAIAFFRARVSTRAE